MGQFDRAIATAKRLIAKNGQTVTWRKTQDGVPADGAKPWKPGTTVVVDYSVPIVFLPESRVGFEFLAMLANTEVPKGKLTGLMAAPADFVPTLKDIVIRGGETYSIRTLDPLAPNGDVILYTIGFDR
jgi:hypothetical protein